MGLPIGLLPLTLLPVGEMARIGTVTGQADQVHRLDELGVRGGAQVEMVRPGSPCIIRLGGQKLCFRCDDMVSILVRRESGS